MKKRKSNGEKKVKPVWKIGHLTCFYVAKHLKQRVFLGIFILCSLWLFFMPWLSFFVFEDRLSFLRETGGSTILIASCLLLYFLATKEINREELGESLALLLTKPISKRDFVLLSWLHLYLTLGLVTLAWGGVLFLSIVWHEGVFLYTIWSSVFLLLLELLILTSFLVFLSLSFSPFFSFLIFLAFFVVAHLRPFWESLLGKLGFLLLLFPDLSFFHFFFLFPEKLSFFYLFIAFLYGILYTTIILMITFALFERMEL